MSLKAKAFEFFTLLGVRLRFDFFNFLEFFKVIYRFYGNRAFRRCDFLLWMSYFYKSPYAISKTYLLDHGAEDPYLYGETPLTAIQEIVKKCSILPSDTVFELGCGTGRCCFWLHAFVGCTVDGIEIIPEFIRKAHYVKQRCGIVSINFMCGDILDADYSKASVIYFFGTSYEDAFIFKLIGKLKKVKPGTKIITVSYALTEYTQKPLFKLIDSFSASFGWGEVDVYLQVRTDQLT